MKIKYIILILVYSTCLSVHAKKIPGYIIDKEGNKMETVFQIQYNYLTGKFNYPKLQKSVLYYTVDNYKKRLFPEDCKGIGLDLNDSIIEFIALKNKYLTKGIYPDYLFLRPKIVGPVTVYYYYFNHSYAVGSQDGSMSTSSIMMNGWILENELGPYFAIKYGNGSREEYSQLFFDCPELVEKIENKEIKVSQMELMVRVYNKWKKIQDMPVNNTLKDSADIKKE